MRRDSSSNNNNNSINLINVLNVTSYLSERRSSTTPVARQVRGESPDLVRVGVHWGVAGARPASRRRRLPPGPARGRGAVEQAQEEEGPDHHGVGVCVLSGDGGGGEDRSGVARRDHVVKGGAAHKVRRTFSRCKLTSRQDASHTRANLDRLLLLEQYWCNQEGGGKDNWKEI